MTTLITKYDLVGTGTVNRPINEKLKETVSVMDFIPSSVNTSTTDCGTYVQAAVNYCLTNAMDLTVPQLIRIATSVNIDRPVDAQIDLFTIRGTSSNGGFYSDTAISIFSSTLPIAYGTTPPSEYIRFQNVYFTSSANTVNNFVVDGTKFLRMKFEGCTFEKIRLAYTNLFFQTWTISGCLVKGILGIWMQATTTGSIGTVPGWGFDLHFTDNTFELSDLTAPNTCAMLNLAGAWSGGDATGNLYESWSGPFVSASCQAVNFSGNYFENVTTSVFILQRSLSVNFSGNQFTTSSDPAYYAIDCGISFTVVGSGNGAYGNLYKASNMTNPVVLTNSGFYKTASYGLLSFGDYSYYGTLSDVSGQTTNIHNLTSATVNAGISDYSVGNVTQLVQTYHTDGVSGSIAPGGVRVYTTPGNLAALQLEYFLFDGVSGEKTNPTLKLNASGVGIFQSATAPVYQKGALYFDTTTNKLCVGGATAWETITSS